MRGQIVPTLASDVVAFKHKRALDGHGAFEVFRYSAPDIGDVTFDVRGIKAALAAHKLDFAMCVCDLESAWVEHIRDNNGVEIEHMARLTAADLDRPGIIVVWDDGMSTLIDGNHRAVRRWDIGLRTFRFANLFISRELAPYMAAG